MDNFIGEIKSTMQSIYKWFDFKTIDKVPIKAKISSESLIYLLKYNTWKILVQ